MAKDNPTETPKPSFSETAARDNFIAVALREIIADQMTQKKWDAKMAATWAVRYGNEVMAAKGNTALLNVVMTKGTATPAQEKFEKVVSDIVEKSAAPPPKTIAEIIGDLPEVAEVK